MGYTIVLTGGIASGKTYVMSIFRGMGFVTISSDSLAHQALDDCKYELIDIFGKEIIEPSPWLKRRRLNTKAVQDPKPDKAIALNTEAYDWTINRKILGDIVFFSQEKRKILESIIHPRIAKIRNQKIEVNKSNPIILEIPLFFEAKVEVIHDVVLSVVCSLQKQRDRAMLRKSMTDSKFNAIVAAQLTNQQRIELSDCVIDTNGSKLYVRDSVARFLREHVRNKRHSTRHGN